HMMFKGTDRVGPKDHFGLLQQVGSSTNANTSFDRTAYVQTLPSDQLDLAMWLEAERMTFLKIDQQAFDTERNVVQEELRMGENRPYGTMFKRMLAELYSKHPYRWSAIGKMDHLRATSVEELRQFWSKYYVPSNATLVIVGAVKHENAQLLAEQYFGWIPKYPVPERVKIKEPKQTAAKRLVIDDENAPAGLVNIIFRTVPAGHKDETTLELLAEILGGGNSSRLYRDLVAQRQLSVGASASTFNLAQDGLFFADATQGPQGDLDIIEAAIWEQIDKIIADGVTEEELEKARNQKLKSVVTRNLTVTSKANLLGNAAAVVNDIDSVNTVLDDINAVTANGIQKAAKKYLARSRSTTFVVKQNMAGSNAGQKDIADASITSPHEDIAPPPGRPGVKRPKLFPKTAPTRKLDTLITSQKHTPTVLSNGLKVIVIPNNEVPFVSVRLGFQAGAWTETKPGTASMALSMLTKGTEKYSEAELAQTLETYAISL
ncbi:MAG: insulinase family protein, partial [Anaerohalosphaera sp.]|nr:insulinase family protein [Anaerohalosphaera sp.]